MNTAEKLTQLFKDNFVTYFRSHVAHVNVTGRNFRSDHKLLEGVYTRRQDQIDRIGELLRSIGEFMPQSIYDVIDDSAIPTDAVEGSADTLLETVLLDLEHLLADFKELIIIADNEGYDEIGNYAQDQALDIEKSIWMLKATLD
jgi:starvation-inducible DNA-binding protein